MIPTLVRRLAQPAKQAAVKSAQASNFVQTKKVWPPNFKELSRQQQLRFEKKYKRRVTLASQRPRWEKGVKYAQLATIAGELLRSDCGVKPCNEASLTLSLLAALVWLLFYSEFEWWGQKYKPSEEVCVSLTLRLEGFANLIDSSARAIPLWRHGS